MTEQINEKQQEKAEGAKPNDTETNTGNGDNSERLGIVEKAQVTADRIEKAALRAEQAVARVERLTAESILGGRSVAGVKIPTEKDLQDKKDEEYSQKVLKNYFG